MRKKFFLLFCNILCITGYLSLGIRSRTYGENTCVPPQEILDKGVTLTFSATSLPPIFTYFALIKLNGRYQISPLYGFNADSSLSIDVYRIYSNAAQ